MTADPTVQQDSASLANGDPERGVFVLTVLTMASYRTGGKPPVRSLGVVVKSIKDSLHIIGDIMRHDLTTRKRLVSSNEGLLCYFWRPGYYLPFKYWITLS